MAKIDPLKLAQLVTQSIEPSTAKKRMRRNQSIERKIILG
jgi:hypothetical protein